MNHWFWKMLFVLAFAASSFGTSQIANALSSGSAKRLCAHDPLGLHWCGVGTQCCQYCVASTGNCYNIVCNGQNCTVYRFVFPRSSGRTAPWPTQSR